MYRALLLGVRRWLLLAVGHDALWWLVAPRPGMRIERERWRLECCWKKVRTDVLERSLQRV
jgi:hypothetical protein